MPLGDVRCLLDDVFQPRHFFVGPGLTVTWQHGVEEVTLWETYQGRLLDARQTRQQRAFVSWNLLEQTGALPLTPLPSPQPSRIRGEGVLGGEGRSLTAPLVSLKWDAERGEVHVVRGLLCHVWEAADGGGNVIESRETTKWLMERVGTIVLADFNDEDELRDELICRLWQAVVGTSRLPLTSLEAPMPGFVLGQLAYVYRPSRGDQQTGRQGRAVRDWRELVEDGWRQELAWREQAKLLELVLRTATPAEIPEVAMALGHPPCELMRLLKTIFNDVSLSPWTGFVDNTLAFLQSLVLTEAIFGSEEIAFLGWLLVKLSGHLTAYDLVTFHHRGANYPDALLLDAVLKRLLQIAQRHTELFFEEAAGRSGTSARRALLHGALLRRMYEGLAVPDSPTSPGENARVLPAPFERVPEEQLTNPLRRRRKLFADDPLVRLWTPTTKNIFQRCLEDLAEFREIIDLGRAVFVDRPLGFGKMPLEPDQTPLLAHSLYSQAIARRRMDVLGDMAQQMGLTLPANWQQSLEALEKLSWADSTPIAPCRSLGRPVAQLADAQRVSPDFVVVETLVGSVQRLHDLFDWSGLEQRFALNQHWPANIQVLRIDSGKDGSVMAICNGWYTAVSRQLVFESDPSLGFRCRGGVELPVAGLRIWQVIDDDRTTHDLRGEEVHVLPRW